MALASIARRTTNATTAQTAHGLITTSGVRATLIEAGIFLAAATASTYGIGRPAAAGVTPTSPVALLQEDPAGPTPATTSALAYGTSPTSPTNAFRRIGLPAVVSTGVIWTFPRGILIAVSSEFVLQNLATNGVCDSYFVVDE